MQKKLITLVCLVAISLAFVACDSKIEGVPANKVLSELNEEEQGAFCDYMGDTVMELFAGDEFKESMCLSMAASFAGFGGDDEDEQVAACEESFTECMEGEDESDDFDASQVCPSPDELAGCEATMQEIHDCFQAMMALQKEEAAKVTQYSCEDLLKGGKLEEIQHGPEDGQPEACEVLEEKCSLMG